MKRIFFPLLAFAFFFPQISFADTEIPVSITTAGVFSSVNNIFSPYATGCTSVAYQNTYNATTTNIGGSGGSCVYFASSTPDLVSYVNGSGTNGTTDIPYMYSIYHGGVAPVGDYWIGWTSSDWVGYKYARFHKDGAGVWTNTYVPPVDGITSTTDPTSMTYSQNPITFSGTYNNGQQIGYDEIIFDITNTTEGFEQSIIKPTTLSSATGIAYNFNQNLPLQGNYTYNVRLWSTMSATGTPWFTGNPFSLGTTTATSTAPIFGTTTLVCSTWDLTCYVEKAFIWLLFPTDSLVSSYQGFLTTIQSKPPIGYFTLLMTNLNGLNASSTPIVVVTIPAQIKSIFFSPFDIAIGSILWLFFAVNFYRRLKHIQL